jgi:hypothetical protein
VFDFEVILFMLIPRKKKQMLIPQGFLVCLCLPRRLRFDMCHISMIHGVLNDLSLLAGVA